MGKPEPVTLAPASRASMPSASPASQCGRTSLPSGRTCGVGAPRARRRAPGLDRPADLLRDGVPLGLQPVRLPQQPAAALIERNRGVDRGGVLALVERALAQPRRIVAQALQPDAHAAAPATAPASRLRPATKAGAGGGRTPP